MVYFVLALALFHDGYEEVLRKLVNGLRFARGSRHAGPSPDVNSGVNARTSAADADKKPSGAAAAAL